MQDARGVQIGEGNTQIIYEYKGTWTDGVAPPPLASVSGKIESPYRGLGAFRERDAPYFFGREEAAAQVLERMSRLADGQGMLVVSGASGAGKSSLLQAGVLPRLRGDGLASAPGAASWPCLLLVPGRAPLDELAARVAMLAGADATAVREGLETSPARFAQTARLAALAQPPPAGTGPGAPVTQGPSGARLLLIVDQFEQVFTQCEHETQRRAFIAALHAVAHGPGGTPAALVVLGVRADFEARCAAYPELTGAIQDRYLVTPMTERQLRLAITGPAGAAGARVDDELTGTLLDDVARRPGGTGAGVLPLLSHALDQAWRKRAGQDLSLADFDRAGGIEGAVAASAERAYGKLTPRQKAAARQVFTRLVATSPDGTDTADRATRAELTGGKDPDGVADVEAVLEAFAAERLLTLAADSVEISHEALLTAWPLLRDTWLAETHADRIVRTRLRGTAAEWERRGRDPSYLYRGTLLQTADETAERAAADRARNLPLGQSECDFLDASRRASRRSARWRQAAIAILAALALVAGGLAIWANQQRDQAIENQIVAEAGQLSATDPSLAAQLLLTAYRRDPSQDLASRLISTENLPLSVSEPTKNSVFSVALSPDGKTLAAGDWTGKVMLWNVTDPGRPLQRVQLTASNGGTVESVAFSPDGRTLTAGDYGGGVTLWDVSNPGRPLWRSHRTVDDGRGVYSVAFSPDGKTLAVGDNRGAVALWDVSDPVHPHQRGQLTASKGRSVHLVAFSPDGRILAAGDDGGVVTLWDVSGPGRPLQRSQSVGDGSGVLSVAFSPDGRTLAAGDYRGVVTLWDVSDPVHPHQRGQFAVGDGSIVDSVAFSPDGKTLAVGDDDGAVALWDVTDPVHPHQRGQLTASNGSPVHSVAFSRDGKILSAGDNDGAVTLWGLPPTTLFASSKGPWVTIENSVAFRADGGKTLAAVGDSNGAVTLWDVTDPGHPHWLSQLTVGNGSNVYSVAFSSGGKTLAVGDSNGQVALWDVADPAHPFQLGNTLTAVGNGVGVSSVAFSSGGKTLAVGDKRGTVGLWDVTDPARPRQRSHATVSRNGTPVKSVAFSPDRKALAVGDSNGTVTLLDVADPARPLQRSQLTVSDGSSVESVAFSPDGKTLAAGDDGGAVVLWDATDPAHLSQRGQPLTASNSVHSVAFSRDGNTLVTSESGATTQAWNLDVSYAISRTCQLASGALTPGRWHQYIPQLDYDPPCPSDR